MKTQHDDLMEAKENLLKIIDELEVGMRKQFKEKFEEIKIEFDKVFKELFGGGKGTIELTEAEDILEAGINIISQPPGKKLQNMCSYQVRKGTYSHKSVVCHPEPEAFTVLSFR